MNRLHRAADQVTDPKLAADLRALADLLDEKWRDLSVDFRVGGIADALTSFIEMPSDETRPPMRDARQAIEAALNS